MNRLQKVLCVVCDHATAYPDNNGFCQTCAGEFEQVRAKLRCRANKCESPLSCMIAKRCLSENVTQCLLFE